MIKYISDRNQTADILRLILILMVVAIHVEVFSYHPVLSFFTVDGFFRIAVPIFFIINGYYFHKNVIDLQSFKKWLSRVIVLFICWQVIYLPMYIPTDGFNLRHLTVFMSEVIFGYHHLWYISAMALGGAGLYFLKNHKHALSLCVFLYIVGWVLQYVRVYLNVDSIFYKIFSQYWIFRNGVFFGLPMMFIGAYISKNNLIERFNSKANIIFVFVFFIIMLAELALTYIFIFKGVTYHIDFILSLLIVCPLIFISIMRCRYVYFDSINTKSFALVSSAIYFVHPYVIKLVSIIGLSSTEGSYFLIVAISGFISICLFLFRKKLFFIF